MPPRVRIGHSKPNWLDASGTGAAHFFSRAKKNQSGYPGNSSKSPTAGKIFKAGAAANLERQCPKKKV
jgi:hypothetical protein